MTNPVDTIRALHRDGLIALTAMMERVENDGGPLDLEPLFITLWNVVDETREALEELYAVELSGLGDLLIRQHLESSFQLKSNILDQLTYEVTYDEIAAAHLMWEAQPFLRLIPS